MIIAEPLNMITEGTPSRGIHHSGDQSKGCMFNRGDDPIGPIPWLNPKRPFRTPKRPLKIPSERALGRAWLVWLNSRLFFSPLVSEIIYFYFHKESDFSLGSVILSHSTIHHVSSPSSKHGLVPIHHSEATDFVEREKVSTLNIHFEK